jgi:thioester reductase-like protein
MNILLTGAAGIVGAELAHRLSAQGHCVVALLRNRTKVVLNNRRALAVDRFDGRFVAGRVLAVHGDLTQMGIGLPESVHRQLSGCIDLIVHSAAITEFGHPSDVYQNVNVGGTREVLAFASPKAIPLVYVSTAYVCGHSEGKIPEAELMRPDRFGNAYEESKFASEGLVRSASGAGMPCVIVRPSIVVGSSRNGCIREFKNIYLALKVLTHGKVSSIPGNPRATLDLVPLDYVSDAIAKVVDSYRHHLGKTFHLVGREALTLQDFSDVIAEYPALHVPRFVPIASFSLEALTPSEQRYYRRIVSLYESYFVRHVEFASANTLSLMNGERPPRGRALLRKLLNYCEDVGFLGTAQRALAD